jgi:hypothetical protein
MGSFEKAYPHIAEWVDSQGWIEIGYDPGTNALVRALDEGGLVWEGDSNYKTLDDALQALEQGLAKWMDKHFT